MAPSISFSSETSVSQRRSSIYTAPQKKQKMSITQTYFLAHSARGKLAKEASRADHDLRLLVGHANMLDSLMIDLANAEQEQERWFNKSLSGAREQEEKISHEETIMEESETEWEAEDAESSDDSDSEDHFESTEDDEEDESLMLTRTVSRSRHEPPQLALDDEDSESDDEHMPPSPPNLSLDNLPSTKSFESDDFYLHSQHQPTIIAAY